MEGFLIVLKWVCLILLSVVGMVLATDPNFSNLGFILGVWLLLIIRARCSQKFHKLRKEIKKMKMIFNITLILLSVIFIIQGFRVDFTIATQSEIISVFDLTFNWYYNSGYYMENQLICVNLSI